jgi:hypothetical protein
MNNSGELSIGDTNIVAHLASEGVRVPFGFVRDNFELETERYPNKPEH